MRRKADAAQWQSRAFANLEVDQRQGNRDAQTPIDDLVQVTVARVVVVARVATKALFAKQQRVQRGNLPLGHGFVRQSRAECLSELLELVQVGVWLEAWVFFAGD